MAVSRAGSPPDGNGCANARAFRIRATIANKCKQVEWTTTSTSGNTGLVSISIRRWPASAYTDPIKSIVQRDPPSAAVLVRFRYTHVFSSHLVNYFNPAFSWYGEPFWSGEFRADARGVSHCVGEVLEPALRSRRSGVWNNTWVKAGAPRASSSMTILPGAWARMSCALVPTPGSSG